MKPVFVLMFGAVLLGTTPGFGQDQERRFGAEFTSTFWIPDVHGTIQSGNPEVDLRDELGVVDRRFNSLMKVSLKFGNTHRVVVEGASYKFQGSSDISAPFEFSGTAYSLQDTVYAQPTIHYIFGGYARDVFKRDLDHLEVEVGAAYFNGKGRLESLRTGAVADLSRGFPMLPLGGIEYQRFLTGVLDRFEISGQASGMTLGSIGSYFKGSATGGARITNHVVVHAGYAIMSLDAHKDDQGVDVKLRGPVFRIEFRN